MVKIGKRKNYNYEKKLIINIDINYYNNFNWL